MVQAMIMSMLFCAVGMSACARALIFHDTKPLRVTFLCVVALLIIAL